MFLNMPNSCPRRITALAVPCLYKTVPSDGPRFILLHQFKDCHFREAFPDHPGQREPPVSLYHHTQFPLSPHRIYLFICWFATWDYLQQHLRMSAP